MGNQQLKSNVDNKFFQSSFILKEHSNMPPSDKKQEKKVRFNSKLQNELTVPFNNKPQGDSTRNFLDVDYGNKTSRFRYIETKLIPQDRKNIIITHLENIQNQEEEDSLRVTHIDVNTKKSQMKQNSPGLFSILTPDKLVSHKSMLHEKVQDQTKLGIEEIKKSKSRSECRIKPDVNEQITQEKCEQSRQDQQPRQNKMRIPSAIDDVDTIQLNQSNPGMWLKNTLKSSQNTVKQIFNQNYTQKGYFVLTDTIVEDKNFQMSQIKSKISEKYQESQSSTQCECNLIIPLIKLFSSKQKEGSKRRQNNEMQNSNDLTQNKIIAEKKGNIIEKKE